MKTTLFTGAAIAIVTPMNKDGSVNYDMFKKLIDYQIENGTDAIVVCGTTGEAATLTVEEHLNCISFVSNYVKKRVPVIAGTGSNCTDTAVFLSKSAEAAGADGLLVVSPYYNKATQKGLIEHFGKIASSVDIPILLYNIPSRTGLSIAPETIKALVDRYENIVGVKDATGDLKWTGKVAMLCGERLDIYSGDDNAILPILSLGGKGVISVLSHVAPRDTHDIVEKYLSGDHKGALELQLKYLPLINALFCEVNPIPVKEACKYIGFDCGPTRLPLTPMDDANVTKLYNELYNVGLARTSK